MGYTVQVPGSCGELVQGYLNESNFLISCPIDIYSTVTVHKLNTNQIDIAPNKSKTCAALKKLLEYYQITNTGFQVEINSKLPVSKGMSSSTADMSAALIAAVGELNLTLDISLIKQILIEVEPTDATFLQGINYFDHIEGENTEYLGNIEPIPLLVYDYGGRVETLAFNQRKDLYDLNINKGNQIKKAYSLVKQGIEKNNLKMIGQAATSSSLANQSILRKKGLKKLVDILDEQPGFLGLNTAHSGTVVGIMVRDQKYFTELIKTIDKQSPKLKLLFKTKIVNGGYKIINKEG